MIEYDELKRTVTLHIAGNSNSAKVCREVAKYLVNAIQVEFPIMAEKVNKMIREEQDKNNEVIQP